VLKSAFREPRRRIRSRGKFCKVNAARPPRAHPHSQNPLFSLRFFCVRSGRAACRQIVMCNVICLNWSVNKWNPSWCSAKKSTLRLFARRWSPSSAQTIHNEIDRTKNRRSSKWIKTGVCNRVDTGTTQVACVVLLQALVVSSRAWDPKTILFMRWETELCLFYLHLGFRMCCIVVSCHFYPRLGFQDRFLSNVLPYLE
jgi:hypothetical protein